MADDTRTLQVWPSGRSYEISGDYHDTESRMLRAYDHNKRSTEQAAWRDGQPDEWQEIIRSIRADMYADRDVYHVDSMLVSELIGASLGGASSELAEAFTDDEQRNLYPEPEDWDLSQCREWLDDHGVDYEHLPDPDTMTREQCAELLEQTGTASFDDEPIEDLRGAVEEQINGEDLDGLDEWRELVRDRSEPAEVMEWWRVSSWLCEQLHAIGEVTIDNGYGHWWGRCATGQAFIMDGVLQRIAARFDS